MSTRTRAAIAIKNIETLIPIANKIIGLAEYKGEIYVRAIILAAALNMALDNITELNKELYKDNVHTKKSNSCSNGGCKTCNSTR